MNRLVRHLVYLPKCTRACIGEAQRQFFNSIRFEAG